jgi:hypothetical protein
MRSHKLRCWNVAGACACASAGVAGTVWLSDAFLTAPAGVPLFFLFASSTMFAALLAASAAWTGGRIRAVAAIVLTSFTSVYPIAYASEGLRNWMYRSDPTGVGDDVARGPCTSRTTSSVSNGSITADVRETYCEGNWSGDLMYFVFVRTPDGRNVRSSLVYRYAAFTGGSATPPIVQWMAPLRLRITGVRAPIQGTFYHRDRILGTTIDDALSSL